MAEEKEKRGGEGNERREAGLKEVESVKDFGSLMERKGVSGGGGGVRVMRMELGLAACPEQITPQREEA